MCHIFYTKFDEWKQSMYHIVDQTNDYGTYEKAEIKKFPSTNIITTVQGVKI